MREAFARERRPVRDETARLPDMAALESAGIGADPRTGG